MILSWDSLGHGPPLALLHGFTGSRETWGLAGDLLARRYRLVRIDLPGHGKSPLPDARDDFEAAVDAVAEALARASDAPVGLLGYSMGARVALGVALRHPDRIDRLVLESGSAGIATPEARSARCQEDAIWRERLASEPIEHVVDRWEQVPVLAGLLRLSADERARLRAIRLNQRPRGLAAALATLGLGAQPDYAPLLDRCATPTLLLTGSEDTKFSAIAAELLRRLPHGEHRSIAGCGHTPHLEAPESWAQHVASFLETPPHSNSSRRTA